jgi:hypothetical protein
MPRGSKGARLYLRQRRKREAVWVILDHGHEISTGAGEGDISARLKKPSPTTSDTNVSQNSETDIPVKS